MNSAFEESVVFKIMGTFNALDCTDLIFKAKKLIREESIDFLVEQTKGDRHLSLQISASEGDILVDIFEVDGRFNMNHPFIFTHLFYGLYDETTDLYVLNQTVASNDTTMYAPISPIEVTHILKSYNKKVKNGI
jgi:hypothetical protein